MTRPYYQGAHGALVICDVVRSASLEAVQAWKSDIDLNLPDLPVVLIANKVSKCMDTLAGIGFFTVFMYLPVRYVERWNRRNVDRGEAARIHFKNEFCWMVRTLVDLIVI